MIPRAAARAEARALLRLALPLIAAQVTFMGFGVVDTLMAGRLGGAALAAVALGHSLWMIPFVGFMGVLAALSPLVAHRVGANLPAPQIGAFVRGALRLALGLSLLWFLGVRAIAGPVFAALDLPPATAALARDYLYAESWSAPLFCLCFALRNLIEGLGHSRPILLTGACGLAAKFAGNLVLLPVLGVVGCGWSTVIAAAVMTLVYAAQLHWRPALARARFFDRSVAPPPGLEREVLRLGLPIGCILVAEAGLFGCTALLMGRFGEVAVAAHQIAINFASVVFMVPLGLGMAITVRVGQAAGAGDRAAARLRGQVGMGLGLGFALFSASLMALAPQAIAGLYTGEAAVAQRAQEFLLYAALFQVFDCLQATANGALRGLKDTRLPMAITLTAYWIAGMPVGAGFAFGLGFGPAALWWGLVAGLVVAAAGLALRFARVSLSPARSDLVP